MASVNRVYAARLAGMVVLGPDGESIGRVRDVVISISLVRQQPRVLGLVIELLSRRRIFVPILRVTAIEPGAVTLATGSVSLRRFSQRPGEVLVLGQVIETRVRVDDPDLTELAGIDVVVVDLGIEQTRTRDWMVTKVAVRPQRRLGRRSNVHTVDWPHVQGLTPSGLAMPDQGVAQLLEQFVGQRPIEVADAIRELPAKRRYEVVNALDDERLADVLQELPEDEQVAGLEQHVDVGLAAALGVAEPEGGAVADRQRDDCGVADLLLVLVHAHLGGRVVEVDQHRIHLIPPADPSVISVGPSVICIDPSVILAGPSVISAVRRSDRLASELLEPVRYGGNRCSIDVVGGA